MYFKILLSILLISIYLVKSDVVWPATIFRERYYFSNGYLDTKQQKPGYEFLPNIINNYLDPIGGYPVLNSSTTRRLPTVYKYSDFEFIFNGTTPSPLCIIDSKFTLSESTEKLSEEKNKSSYIFLQENYVPPENLDCQFVDRPTFCFQINTNWTFTETSYLEFSIVDNLWLFLDNQLIFDNGGYTNGNQEVFSLNFETGKYTWSSNNTDKEFDFNSSQFYNKLTKVDIFHCKFMKNETLYFSIMNTTVIKTVLPTPTPTTQPPVDECDRSPQPFKCKKGPIIGIAIGAVAAAAAVGAAIFFGKKKFDKVTTPSSAIMGNVQDNPLFVHSNSSIDNLIYDPKQ